MDWLFLGASLVCSAIVGMLIANLVVIARARHITEELGEIGAKLDAEDTGMQLLEQLTIQTVIGQRSMLRLISVCREVMLICDSSGAIQFCGGAIHRSLGYMPNELKGQRWVDLIHPTDLPKGPNPAIRFFPERRTRWSHKDGGYVWMDWSSSLWSDDGNTYAAGRVVS